MPYLFSIALCPHEAMKYARNVSPRRVLDVLWNALNALTTAAYCHFPLSSDEYYVFRFGWLSLYELYGPGRCTGSLPCLGGDLFHKRLHGALDVNLEIRYVRFLCHPMILLHQCILPYSPINFPSAMQHMVNPFPMAGTEPKEKRFGPRQFKEGRTRLTHGQTGRIVDRKQMTSR